MPEPVVFRPRAGQVLAWTAIGVCGAGLVYIALAESVTSLVFGAWPIVLVAWLAWVLYVRPAVVVTDGFVEIVNPFRTHRVPWGDIDQVDSRYALTVHTRSGRRIRAWAAPAPGARQALSTRREEVSRTPGDGETRRPSDAEGTLSGDAASLLRRRQAESERRGVDPAAQTVSTLTVPVIAGTAVLVAAAVLTLTLPHG